MHETTSSKLSALYGKLRTTKTIHWDRSCSAIPGGIDFPKGSPVVYTDTGLYISPKAGQGPIVAHDLTHYGCVIDEAFVEEGHPCYPVRSLHPMAKARANEYIELLLEQSGCDRATLEWSCVFYDDGSPCTGEGE